VPLLRVTDDVPKSLDSFFFCRGFRNTEAHPVALATMDEEAEYVVIGAGLAGLTAARALHQLGAKGTRAHSTARTLSSLPNLAHLFVPTTAAAAAHLESSRARSS
jgi:heterodisulfide reductase subunit A-like polyferredoxin